MKDLIVTYPAHGDGPVLHACINEGKIQMEGLVATYLDDWNEAYIDPLISWIENFFKKPENDGLIFQINLSYYYPIIEESIHDLFERFQEKNYSIKIEWYYNEDDYPFGDENFQKSFPKLDFKLFPHEDGFRLPIFV